MEAPTLESIAADLLSGKHALSVPRPRMGPQDIWVLPAKAGAVHYLCFRAPGVLTELNEVAEAHLPELLRSRCSPPWTTEQRVAVADVPPDVLAAREARLAHRARLREAMRGVGHAIKMEDDGQFVHWLHRAEDGVELVAIADGSVAQRALVREDTLDAQLDPFLAAQDPGETTQFPEPLKTALAEGLARFRTAWSALQAGELGLVVHSKGLVTASEGSLWNVSFAGTSATVTQSTKIPPWNEAGMEDILRTRAGKSADELARFTAPINEAQRAALADITRAAR